MKRLILLTIAIPSLSCGMETAQPTIKIKEKKFASLLQEHLTAQGSYDNFCHHINIPAQGALFELHAQGLGFYPPIKKLTIDSGTKFINIIGQKGNLFAIINDSGREIAQLVKLEKRKKQNSAT